MEGKVIEEWDSFALTERNGRYYLWESVEENDGYSRNLSPKKGFGKEQDAKDFLMGRDKYRKQTRVLKTRQPK